MDLLSDSVTVFETAWTRGRAAAARSAGGEGEGRLRNDRTCYAAALMTVGSAPADV